MRVSERDRASMAVLVAKLRAAAAGDERVLAAMESLPRRVFVSAPYQADAYLDRAIPIECGQSMTSPTTVAAMITALDVKPEHKVLEVGCGSGYQAAVLSRLARSVVTLDRFRTLVELAEDRMTALKVEGVTALVADGLEGFTRHAPYDRILVDGAVPKIPGPLMDQLADKGVMVAPVGTGGSQALVRIVRDGRLYHRAEFGQVRYVPLIEGVASRL
jgi:protein-L-isoaspartate(D-aspartate) O-methyltransferase